jgi:hypothetical protein
MVGGNIDVAKRHPAAKIPMTVCFKSIISTSLHRFKSNYKSNLTDSSSKRDTFVLLPNGSGANSISGYGQVVGFDTRQTGCRREAKSTFGSARDAHRPSGRADFAINERLNFRLRTNGHTPPSP